MSKIHNVTWVGFLFFSSLVVPMARVQAQEVPHFKVDPFWPKELPNNWILGRVAGVAVDKDDHIWVLQSPNWVIEDAATGAHKPPLSECCVPAPAVLEFDTDGNVIRSWGGPGYVPDWPTQEHALAVDGDGNIWIGGIWDGQYPPGPEIPLERRQVRDRQVLKFTPDGRLILEIGHPTDSPENNQDTTILGGPAGITVDDAAHEVYIADGSLNRRVVVYDSMTGKFKRGWGAYGIPLSEVDNSRAAHYDPSAPPSKQFGGMVNDVRISNDGLVYVADRTDDRVQVFTKQGKFLKEFFVSPQTRNRGTVMTLAFSHDPAQKYLLVGDGGDCVVWILNRDDGPVAGKFGHRGYYAGQFYFIQDMATDSHGNLYTGEVNHNNRVQKFVFEK
jgi:hypothetical protein